MSNLTRWDPFREMMNLRSAMDRLFDDAFFGSRSNWMERSGLDASVWDLALDVAETNDEYVVKASLPGMNPDDLDVTLNNNVLTIQGEIKEEKEDKPSDDRRYHLRERRYGSFSRSISLPSTVNADAIQANFEAGVLTLHLPKVEEAKPRRIEVRSGQKMIEGKAVDIASKN